MKRGSLTVIKGPMFSGKTGKLFQFWRASILSQRKTLMINHSSDTRFTDKGAACTHNLEQVEAVPMNKLDATNPLFQEYDVICIDEGQFFEGLADFCLKMCDAHHKTVVVSALSSDFNRKPWPVISELEAIADTVIPLQAICILCYEPASFSRRISTAPIKDESPVDVGGVEKYIPVCRHCYSTKYIPIAKLEHHKKAMEQIRRSK